MHVPNESGLMSEFRAISKIKSADSLRFNVSRVKDDAGTHTHKHTCAVQHMPWRVFSVEFAVKTLCVTVRAAGFPDGCV